MSRPFTLLIFATSLFLANAVRGQEKDVTLSFNVLGFVEPEPAIGIGLGYQWSRHWQVWAEGSALLARTSVGYYSVQPGFRGEMAVKYYFGRANNLFVGGEVRWKQLLYIEHKTLANPTTHDTISVFNCLVWNRMPGTAILAGVRGKLFGNQHFSWELNIGFGLKYRNVQSGQLPAGYVEYRNRPVSVDPTEIEPGERGLLVYIPATLRVVYAF